MRNLNVHTALQHKEGVESISTSNMNEQPASSPQFNSLVDSVEEALGQLDGNVTLTEVDEDDSDQEHHLGTEDNVPQPVQVPAFQGAASDLRHLPPQHFVSPINLFV